MKEKTAPKEEKGEAAPLWIISFADMISLLMAFFVMLCTMATTSRSGKLCDDGTGVFEKTLMGFRSSIAGLGMRGWYGSDPNLLNFDSEKSYYRINGGDKSSAGRIIDAREEKLRRTFKKLSNRAKTLKSQIQGSKPEFTVLPITFERGQFALNETSTQLLSKFSEDLKEAGTADITAVYIVGLAPQEAGKRQQWIVSAKRAQAVADFLKNTSQAQLPVYSWGAASGGSWVAREGPVSKQSQVLIGILRKK